jgi:hypothetical protein
MKGGSIMRFSQSRLLVALTTLIALAAFDSSVQADFLVGSKATSDSYDWFGGRSSGWKKEDRWYTDKAADIPTGRWDDQYKNSFAGTPTAGGGGWTTWSFLNKPNAAGWAAGGTFQSNPYPRTDTSAKGSTAQNWGWINYYKGTFGGYWANKQTQSYANSKNKADNSTIAETQMTDPWTEPSPAKDSSWGSPPPEPDGHWSTRLDYSQFGSFSSPANGSSIFATYSVTLNPSSGSQQPVTYDVLSISLSADGSASINTDLNGNDAEVSNYLIPGQLNGVLQVNGRDVSLAQAESYLLSFYNPRTGWNLNPNGYTMDSFDGDPTQRANVFSLNAFAFLDSSTASVTYSTVDGSEAISVAPDTASVPEPSSIALLVAGTLTLASYGWRRRKRLA